MFIAKSGSGVIGSTSPHRVVLTYGRFDQFNQQHIKFLRQLSTMGHELIVGCTSDNLANFEDRPCMQGFDARRTTLVSCRYVSRVIAKVTNEQIHTDIVNYNVSLFVMSDNWQGKFDHLRDITQVCYLPGYDDHAESMSVRPAISA